MEHIEPPTPPTSPTLNNTPPLPPKRKVGRPRKEPTIPVTETTSFNERERLLQTVKQMEAFLQAQKMKKMIKKTIERQQMKQWMRQPPSYQEEEYTESESEDDASLESESEDEEVEEDEKSEPEETPTNTRSPLLVNRRTVVSRKRQFR